MTTRRISSREFNQDVSGAKRAADRGPVIITDRGEPAYVLLRHDQYRRLREGRRSLVALLDQPRSKAIEFEPVRLGRGWLRPADLE